MSDVKCQACRWIDGKLTVEEAEMEPVRIESDVERAAQALKARIPVVYLSKERADRLFEMIEVIGEIS